MVAQCRVITEERHAVQQMRRYRTLSGSSCGRESLPAHRLCPATKRSLHSSRLMVMVVTAAALFALMGDSKVSLIGLPSRSLSSFDETQPIVRAAPLHYIKGAMTARRAFDIILRRRGCRGGSFAGRLGRVVLSIARLCLLGHVIGRHLVS